MDIRQLYNEDALSDKEKSSLDILAQKIEEGNVILFLGAAVHCRPPKGFESLYPTEERPPLGKDLAGELAKDLPQDVIRDKNLSWIAQYYEAFVDRSGLLAKINDILAGKKPSPLVKALAKMNFHLILTTNYDNLYEDALIAAGKKITNKGIYKPNKEDRFDNDGNPIIQETTPDASMDLVSADEPFLYKIHGDIKDVFEPDDWYKSEKDSIVITDEDYIDFIQRMAGTTDKLNGKNFNPVPRSFTSALSDPKGITVLFIGYSLMDYNLRLLFKSTMWKKDKRSLLKKWSLDLYPDESIKELYTGLYAIKFIERDAWSAIPYLYEKMFNEVMPV